MAELYTVEQLVSDLVRVTGGMAEQSGAFASAHLQRAEELLAGVERLVEATNSNEAREIERSVRRGTEGLNVVLESRRRASESLEGYVSRHFSNTAAGAAASFGSGGANGAGAGPGAPGGPGDASSGASATGSQDASRAAKRAALKKALFATGDVAFTAGGAVIAVAGLAGVASVGSLAVPAAAAAFAWEVVKAWKDEDKFWAAADGFTSDLVWEVAGQLCPAIGVLGTLMDVGDFIDACGSVISAWQEWHQL